MTPRCLMLLGLAASVGDAAESDWRLIEGYLDGSYLEREYAADEEPYVHRALAAARRIVDLDGGHEKTVQAAEFLVERAAATPDAKVEDVWAGIRTLEDHARDYRNWPSMFMHLGRMRADAPELDEFLIAKAAETTDPVEKATARYYAAYRLTKNVNAAPEEGRDAIREQALDLVTGLSVGVEDAEFVAKGMDADLNRTTQTVAEAEQGLLATIHHATVGGTVRDFSGTRIDGVEEGFRTSEGKVVLVNFWATWCGPCIAALPKLRALMQELPDEQFEILNISIDWGLEWLTDFLEDEPLPWRQWYVGPNSELSRMWQVEAVPTYALVDHQGKILAKVNDLSGDLLVAVRNTVVKMQGLHE
ncbi:MAG: TlpA disulfide reductase family protein [Gammaproteobacteria bacterium]|nr:TlpA disulfide reductase family protein [Gammaproteobacteria bacterium]